MKKRIFCTALVLLLTAAVACTEADIQNIKNGNSEVIVLDTENLPAPDIKKPNTEIENNTENGDKDTDSENKDDSFGNTEVTDNTDSAETKGVSEDKKPSIDDYVIEECEGEYVLIKSAVVRSGPSTDFDKLGQLQADIVVEITGTTDNGWFQFEYDSVDGYINQKFFMDKESYDEGIALNESGEENQSEENIEEQTESTLASQIVAIQSSRRA